MRLLKKSSIYVSLQCIHIFTYYLWIHKHLQPNHFVPYLLKQEVKNEAKTEDELEGQEERLPLLNRLGLLIELFSHLQTNFAHVNNECKMISILLQGTS